MFIRLSGCLCPNFGCCWTDASWYVHSLCTKAKHQSTKIAASILLSQIVPPSIDVCPVRGHESVPEYRAILARCSRLRRRAGKRASPSQRRRRRRRRRQWPRERGAPSAATAASEDGGGGGRKRREQQPFLPLLLLLPLPPLLLRARGRRRGGSLLSVTIGRPSRGAGEGRRTGRNQRSSSSCRRSREGGFEFIMTSSSKCL